MNEPTALIEETQQAGCLPRLGCCSICERTFPPDELKEADDFDARGNHRYLSVCGECEEDFATVDIAFNFSANAEPSDCGRKLQPTDSNSTERVAENCGSSSQQRVDMRQKAEALARRFHETYERLAPEHGYETRKESAVAWENVPERNKNLMVAVCAELLPHIETSSATGGAERTSNES